MKDFSKFNPLRAWLKTRETSTLEEVETKPIDTIVSEDGKHAVDKSSGETFDIPIINRTKGAFVKYLSRMHKSAELAVTNNLDEDIYIHSYAISKDVNMDKWNKARIASASIKVLNAAGAVTTGVLIGKSIIGVGAITLGSYIVYDVISHKPKQMLYRQILTVKTVVNS